VQFEITEATREAVVAWVARKDLRSTSFLFPARSNGRHLSLRQYSRIVKGWTACIGLDQTRYGTHSLRRTKATLIYKRTKNIRAIQLLLGHTKLESTLRYLGIEVDDALESASQAGESTCEQPKDERHLGRKPMQRWLRLLQSANSPHFSPAGCWIRAAAADSP
jgi:hypothetical protein